MSQHSMSVHSLYEHSLLGHSRPGHQAHKRTTFMLQAATLTGKDPQGLT
jgi:hypothetical protein